jgi:methylenetetrahydrofolate dehydrogenase (NAD+)
MIVYYPVFDSRRDQTLQWTVSMYKDVEGLSPQLISNMYQNIRFLDVPTNTQKSLLPCTPLAIVKILEHLQIYNTFLDYGKRLFGKRITVINRSEVVGRPLAALLANDGAEVYSVDVTGVQQFSRGSGLKKQKHESRELEGWTLEQCLPLSEVVISGVPGDKFKVPTHLIREGAVCINFSTEKVGCSQFLICKICRSWEKYRRVGFHHHYILIALLSRTSRRMSKTRHPSLCQPLAR